MKGRFGIYLVILLASTLFPIYSLKIVQRTKFHSYLRCFSSGVILSLITLRILPRVYTQHSSFLAPFVSGVVFLALFALERLVFEDTGLLSNKRRYNVALFCATISIQSLQEGFGIFRAAENMRKLFVLKLIGHKWLEGLTLGCVVFDNVFSGFTEHLYVHIYSLLAPLGVVLGMHFKKKGSFVPARARRTFEHWGSDGVFVLRGVYRRNRPRVSSQ